MQQQEKEKSKLISYYLPERILKGIISTDKHQFKRTESLQGGILYFDLVKFTPLTKILSQSGPRGAEKLQELLLVYFTAMIKVIRDFDGSVYQFAGDSALVAFEKKESESDEDTAARLVSCAWVMKNTLLEMPELNLNDSTYKFSTKFSVSYGSYYQIILGNAKNSLDAKIIGEPVTGAIKGEKYSLVDTVVLDPKMLKLLDRSFQTESFNEYAVVSAPKTSIISSFNSDTADFTLDEKPEMIKLCSQFVLPVLVEKILNNYQGFLAEFRDITSVFIQFDGLEYLKNIQSDIKMLNVFYENIIDIANTFGGTLVQTDFSDKKNVFLVIFGAPVAREQKELMSIRFAQRILELRDQFPFLTQLRIGISTGHSYCGEVGAEFRKSYSVLGESVNFASRIMSFASDNSVFIDASTFNKVQDFFNCHAIENVSVKGIQEAVTLYEVQNETASTTKKVLITDRLFGRKKELEIFSQSLKKISNESQSILLVGEAGVGKSRLVAEFANIASTDELEVVFSNCYSYEKFTPFFSWKNIYFYLFGIDEADSEKAKLYKIHEHLESMPEIRIEWVEVFGQILGLDVKEKSFTVELEPRQKNDRISQITYELFQLAGQKHPALFIIEDIHWVDDVSRELLKTILSRPLSNIMLLLAMRPDKLMEEITRLEFVHLMELGEFNSEDARNYLRSRLNLMKPDPDIETEILARAHGNPFFIESIVYTLREQGQVVPERDGRYKLVGSTRNIKIPDTLQDVLLSRIDRLREEEKATLKTASVMGRIFLLDFLKELLPEQIQNSMDSAVSSLERNDFTFLESPDPMSYMFKHILIRDVAYNSMVSNARKELHLKYAMILEKKAGTIGGISVDMLAHHYLEGENSTKALEYSLMAADKAVSRFSNRDAVYYYEKAVEILEKLNVPEENLQLQEIKEKLAHAYGASGSYIKSIELFESCLPYRSTDMKKAEIYIGMGKVLADMGDSAEAVKTFEKGLRLVGGRVPRFKIGLYASIARSLIVHEINDWLPFTVRKQKPNSKKWLRTKKHSEILYNLDKIYFFEDVEKAAWSNFNNVILTDKLNIPEFTALAYANYGMMLVGLGLFNRARKNYEKSMKIAESSGNAVVKAVSFHRYGMMGMYTNTPAEWGESMKKALVTFEEVSDLWEMYISISGIALANYFSSNFSETIKYYTKLLILAEKHHANRFIAWATMSIPFSKYLLGEVIAVTARKNISRGMKLCEEINDILSLITIKHFLCTISIRENDLERLLDDVINNFNEVNKYSIFVPDAHIAYSSAAEGAIICLKNGIGNKSTLKKIIHKSIKKLLGWGKSFTYVYGPALRVQAQYLDYLGKKDQARKWFLKAIHVYETSENRWEAGLAYFEAAKSLEDKRGEFLDMAESIFKEKSLLVELERLSDYRASLS